MSMEKGLQAPDGRPSVYIVSGPLGVGKSTTSKLLVELIQPGVRIEGDNLLHMLGDGLPLTWEERLEVSWDNIASLTEHLVRRRLNVVIDFVVEEELDWFSSRMKELGVRLYYAVLRADPETIIERLNRRGDPESLERSLFLLRKMAASEVHQPFLIDTIGRTPEETAAEILSNPKFKVIDPV